MKMSHLNIRRVHIYKKNNGEVLLTRTDLPETIIDVPVEEFVNQQLGVEYEEEFEDEFKHESENEYEDEFSDAFEDESKNEYEDESDDEVESEEESE